MRMAVLLALLLVLQYSCKKKKEYVPATVAVYVKHHGALIPAAKVYVKYDAKEFPGTEASNYNDSAVCGVEGHGIGHTHFKDLAAGDYYFYSTGYDSTIMDEVIGGIGLTVGESEEKQELTLDIPVTE